MPVTKSSITRQDCPGIQHLSPHGIQPELLEEELLDIQSGFSLQIEELVGQQPP